MRKDDKDIDSALQDAVAGKVGRERFDLWFGDGVQLSLADGSLLVRAAHQFTLDRLRKQFRRELIAAGESVANGPVDVRFQLTASTAPDDPSETTSDGQRPVSDGQRSVSDGQRPDTAVGGNQKSGSPNGARRFAKLDDFVVGTGNRMAYTGAKMVVDRPGAVSPLFIYGATGSGKTHLLEGIWSAARSGSLRRRAVYLSAEQFTSMFLEALRGSGLPSFRFKYRHVDLLLIDDVQFFLGKRATLVELQSTVDALLRERRQLVFAADRAPAELGRFGPELTARFSGGLVCGIEPADIETRLGILRRLAGRKGSHFSADVLKLIAEHLDGDARKLSGALNQLEATSRAFQRPVNVDLAHTALADVFRATRRVVQLDDIDRAVCDVFGLEPSSLQSMRKARVFSQPRALAMWLARKYTRAAFSEIGDYFGRRSHSTVISAQKQVGRWRDEHEAIRLAHGKCDIEEAIRRVESQIRAG